MNAWRGRGAGGKPTNHPGLEDSIMPKITTFLAYKKQAEAAAKFYVSVFKNSRIKKITHYGEGGPGRKGTVMTVVFELDGEEFVAINGGAHFKFTDAISLSVECKNQKEIDRYWTKLSRGGEKGPCGWVRDKFGLWWQVNPAVLARMFDDAHPKRAKRVMAAMLKMKKLNIAALQKAYDG
jgi:predicted 3-demethylubiquinone-9 3-methyltransferase (glyoxalase superfamily)